MAPQSAAKTPLPPAPIPVPTGRDRDGLTDEDRELLETAVHEAGHAVAAVALGGRISHGYVLPLSRRTGEITGQVVMDGMPVGDATAEIAFAGPLAQARFRAGGHPPSQVMSAVLASAGRLDRRMCDSAGRDGSSVTGLIDRCWPAVITVAKALVSTGEIRHEDVTAALGLSEDPARHPFELANLRAGMRAVPRA